MHLKYHDIQTKLHFLAFNKKGTQNFLRIFLLKLNEFHQTWLESINISLLQMVRLIYNCLSKAVVNALCSKKLLSVGEELPRRVEGYVELRYSRVVDGKMKLF